MKMRAARAKELTNGCYHISAIKQAKESWEREIKLFKKMEIFKIPINCTECRKIAPIIGKEYIDCEKALRVLSDASLGSDVK